MTHKKSEYTWEKRPEYLAQRHYDTPWYKENWKAPPVHIITHIGHTAPTRPGYKYGDTGHLAKCGVILEYPRHLSGITPDDPQDSPPCQRCGSLAEFEAIEQAMKDRAQQARQERISESRDREIEYNWLKTGRQIESLIKEYAALEPDIVIPMPLGLLLSLLENTEPGPDQINHYLMVAGLEPDPSDSQDFYRDWESPPELYPPDSHPYTQYDLDAAG